MTKTEEIMELAREYAFRSSELVGEYPPNGDECEWAKQAENDLKSAIEELVSKSDMDDAMLAGNAALIADMKSKLNECHAELSERAQEVAKVHAEKMSSWSVQKAVIKRLLAKLRELEP